MTSDHINWSTLKAISAFITKNTLNVFFSNGGGGGADLRYALPWMILLFQKGPQTWQCLIKVYVIEK